MRNNTRYLVHGAILAALYAVLCYLQNLILPGSASAMIQVRLAEALCVFAFFTPAAIGGLTVGCLIFNLSNAAMPVDILLGAAATFLATGAMYLTRKITWKGFPLLGIWMPTLFNALIIGWMLSVYVGGGFWLNAMYVGIGETIAVLVFGTILFFAMKLRNLDKRLF